MKNLSSSITSRAIAKYAGQRINQKQISVGTLHEEVLSVPDASCEHCIKTINGAIGKLPGVEAVETDIPTKRVHIRYDQSQLSLERIEATLDDVGDTVAKGPAQTSRTTGKPLNLL